MTASRGVFNSYLPPIPPFTTLPYHKITSIPSEKIKLASLDQPCQQQHHMCNTAAASCWVYRSWREWSLLLVLYKVYGAGFG